MISKIYKELAIIIGIFLVVWAAFTLLRFRPDTPELEVTIEQEEKLGTVMIEHFLSTQKIVTSDTLDSAIHIITSRLLQGLPETDYHYTFYVIQNDEVNAFASLGGHIFIHTGLIEFAESPDEVAAVVAHEIGHVEKRHVVHKIVKELGLTVLFSILSGNDPVLVGEIVRQSVSTIFDRGQEAEADDYGLELMEKVDLSPHELAKIFRRLNEEYGGFNENLEFLMTHPHTPKRIKKSLEYQTGDGYQHRPLELDWEAVKRAL